MGAGVFYSEDGKSVLVNGAEYIGDQSQGDAYLQQELFFDDLVGNIESVLPETYDSYYKGRRAVADDAYVIAENSFYQVSVKGWECDYALIVHPLPNEDFVTGYHPLALANLETAADKIFRAVAGMYELRVRTSGYTTCAYDPTPIKRAA